MISKELIEVEAGEESPMWDFYKDCTKRELVSMLERDSVTNLASRIDVYEFLEKHDMVDTWDKEHPNTMWGGLKRSLDQGISLMKEKNPLLWNFVAKRDFGLYHYRKEK